MLSSADTHGIAKYASTYIRDTNTHARTPKEKKAERLKKRGVVRKERKKKKRKDEKKSRKRRRKMREEGE